MAVKLIEQNHQRKIDIHQVKVFMKDPKVNMREKLLIIMFISSILCSRSYLLYFSKGYGTNSPPFVKIVVIGLRESTVS